jgi:hypothetical protein
LTLLNAGVSDVAGNTLAAEAAVDFFIFPGDFNGDRTIDVHDLRLFAGVMNTPSTGVFDLNHDGRVDFADWAIFASRFGRTLPPPAAPSPLAEPGAARATRPAPATPFGLRPIRDELLTTTTEAG